MTPVCANVASWLGCDMDTMKRLDPFMSMSLYICRYLGSNMLRTCSELGVYTMPPSGKKGRTSVFEDEEVDEVVGEEEVEEDDGSLREGSQDTESTPSSRGS